MTLKTFASGETYCRYEDSIRGRGHLHRPDRIGAGRPAPDGAADHDQRGQARLGEAHHGRDPLVLLRPAGQEVAAARADHGQARRRPAPDRRCRPGPDDGPPCRPGAGVLRDPGRPHDRGADVRAVRSRPQPRRGARPSSRRIPGMPRSQASSPRWSRRPRDPEQGAARAQRGEGHDRDRRRRGQGRRDHRRHHRHRRHARRGRDRR